ncbi:MAG: hypothetical protein WD009_07620 [Phycisphaeraceae bacterium]
MSTTATDVQSPALRYLAEIEQHIEQIRADVPALAQFGHDMAQPMLAGGDISAPRVAAWWPREFGGRAGGLMGLRRRRGRSLPGSSTPPGSDNDVAYIATPDPRKWKAADDENLQRLLDDGLRVFVNGRREDVGDLASHDGFAGFTGGADPAQGRYKFNAIEPLVGFREFHQFVRGWSAAGEMIAACTRGGKMPIIYMSVWFEGSHVRNACFTKKDNLQEPWPVPLFHDNLYIPPPNPGAIATAFIDQAVSIRDTLVAQHDRLVQAAEWLAEARQKGKRTWVVGVGHSYPDIFDWPENDDSFEPPLTWGPSISNLARGIPEDFAEGDTVLHMGYAPVNKEQVQHWMDRGVRLIHTSPYGPALDMKPHDNFLWFDLPWPPGDQAIELPGYSVKILPMSSTAQTMAYFAILSEVAQRMGWEG